VEKKVICSVLRAKIWLEERFVNRVVGKLEIAALEKFLERLYPNREVRSWSGLDSARCREESRPGFRALLHAFPAGN
jgi:hypothetical protein